MVALFCERDHKLAHAVRVMLQLGESLSDLFEGAGMRDKRREAGEVLGQHGQGAGGFVV